MSDRTGIYQQHVADDRIQRLELLVVMLQLLVQVRTEERDHARAAWARIVERSAPVSAEYVEHVLGENGFAVVEGPA